MDHTTAAAGCEHVYTPSKRDAQQRSKQTVVGPVDGWVNQPASHCQSEVMVVYHQRQKLVTDAVVVLKQTIS